MSTEPVTTSETPSAVGPRWLKVDDKSREDYKIKSGLGGEYNVDPWIILYPKVGENSDPLSKAHYGLLAFLAGKSNLERWNMSEADLTTGETAIFFATAKDRSDKLPAERKELINKANTMIISLGGNKLIPEKLEV